MKKSLKLPNAILKQYIDGMVILIIIINNFNSKIPPCSLDEYTFKVTFSDKPITKT